jgi:capsular polysaccharide biosynthesis protein
MERKRMNNLIIAFLVGVIVGMLYAYINDWYWYKKIKAEWIETIETYKRALNSITIYIRNIK